MKSRLVANTDKRLYVYHPPEGGVKHNDYDRGNFIHSSKKDYWQH